MLNSFLIIEIRIDLTHAVLLRTQVIQHQSYATFSKIDASSKYDAPIIANAST